MKFLIALTFILSVSLLPSGSFLALGLLWVLLAGAALAARISPLRVIRGSFVAAPFFLAAFPLVFTKSGDPITDINFGLFSLTLSGEGVRQFVITALKSWVSVQAAVLLTFTTRFPELVEALRRLHVPGIVVAIMGFMYRYLAVLGDESARMLRARAARSASPDGGARGPHLWRAKVVGGMVGALFLRAFERSERVYAAMQARGFQGELKHMSGRPLLAAEWVTLGGAGATLLVVGVAAHAWLPRVS